MNDITDCAVKSQFSFNIEVIQTQDDDTISEDTSVGKYNSLIINQSLIQSQKIVDQC